MDRNPVGAEVPRPIFESRISRERCRIADAGRGKCAREVQATQALRREWSSSAERTPGLAAFLCYDTTRTRRGQQRHVLRGTGSAN